VQLADVATGNALISGGVGVAPAYGKIGLTTHISGVLPVANGGTNASTASITSFNNITGYTASGATGTTSTNLVFSTSPSLTTPRVITSINDTNGNELFGITATASAVNELTVANAATGNNPVISATGSDTNIGITLTPKGTGNAVLTTGNLVVANGNGIDFSATSGTGTSELLDDYEEGTFTPTISGSTSAGAGTYSVQEGRYTKVGNLVYVTAVMTWSAHTGTGNMRLSGLPFTVLNVVGLEPPLSLQVNDVALTALNVALATFRRNATYAEVLQAPVGGGSLTDVPIDTAASIRYAGSFLVA
jgi:hypothetical protein